MTRSARAVEFVHSFLQAVTAKGASARKAIDPARVDRFARTLDDYGFDTPLLRYSSDGADPFSIGSRVATSSHPKPVLRIEAGARSDGPK